jgi:hypothetical protein
MWISLIIYSGTALMAMIIATFHANASETTKERSWKQEKFISVSELTGEKNEKKHTEVGG